MSAEADPSEPADGHASVALGAPLEQIAAFNFSPLSYIHESWLATLPGHQLLGTLKDNQRVGRRLSAYVLERLNLDAQYLFDFSDPFSRLVLIETDQLARLVIHLGLCINSEFIRHIVLRNELAQVKADIGENAYRFALKRAPHLGPIPISLRRGTANRDDYRANCIASGMRCLGVAYSSAERALTGRLVVRLPLAWNDEFALASADSATYAAARSLIARLTMELELA